MTVVPTGILATAAAAGAGRTFASSLAAAGFAKACRGCMAKGEQATTSTQRRLAVLLARESISAHLPSALVFLREKSFSGQQVLPNHSRISPARCLMLDSSQKHQKTPENPSTRGLIPGRAYKVAICGAGPAGLVTLRELGKQWTAATAQESGNRPKLHVDLFDCSLVPLGLIRLGVAPDHLGVKAIGNSILASAEKYRKLAVDDFTFEFHGGAELGKNIQLGDLRRAYDAVVISTGLSGQRLDQPLGIPGEHARGVVTSSEVVEWYNGKMISPPGYLFDLDGKLTTFPAKRDDDRSHQASFRRGVSGPAQEAYPEKFGRFLDEENPDDKVVIIGQGNVAVDIARTLLVNPQSLKPHMIEDRARQYLQSIHNKRIKEFHIVGRRGFLEAAWDLSTLRELFSFRDVQVMVNPVDIKLSTADKTSAKALKTQRSARRMMALIEEAAENYKNDKPEDKKTRIYLRFLQAPSRFFTVPGRHDKSADILQSVELVRTKPQKASPGNSQVTLTNEREILDGVRLAVKSTGFRGSGGWTQFDQYAAEWGDPINVVAGTRILWPRRVYLAPVLVCGWARTHGKGSLSSTIGDATECAVEVLRQLPKLVDAAVAEIQRSFVPSHSIIVPEIGPPVSWEESLKLLGHEVASGRKLAEWNDAIDVLSQLRAEARKKKEALRKQEVQPTPPVAVTTKPE